MLNCQRQLKRGGTAIKKEYKDLLKKLEQAGWELKPIKSGYIAYPPDKTQSGVTIHGTPSDHRAWKNLMSELRKRGFEDR